MTYIDIQKECVLNVHETEEDADGTQEIFKPGTRLEADICSEHKNGTVDLQFGDGSVAFSVSRDLFSVVSQ